MVFDGKMTPWPSGKSLPHSNTYHILVRRIFVRTSNIKSEALQQLIYSGILELTIKGEKMMILPVGSM